MSIIKTSVFILEDNTYVSYILDTPRLKLPQMAVSDRIYSEFKSELDLYVKNINKAISDNENEEQVKNIINDFLRRNFYSVRFNGYDLGNIGQRFLEILPKITEQGDGLKL